MAKNKAHERQLARARQKRERQRSMQRRQRQVRAGVAALVVLLVAVLVGVMVPRGAEPPVIDPGDEPVVDADPPLEADAVACDGEVPEAADEESPQWDEPPEMQIDPQGEYRATLETSCGTIVLELYAARSPTTVNNFVFLAREGFYDGVIFHRVVPGFVIQGGDPTGTGQGGPGYRFEDELALAEEQGYRTGSLAMANAGADTNGSQFFIVLEGGGDQLQPLYNLFGEVVEGMDVADTIAGLQLMGQRPAQTVYIESVTIEENAGGDAPATDDETTDDATTEGDET